MNVYTLFLQDTIMKAEKNKTFVRGKWSIKQCEDDKGWKLKSKSLMKYI